MVKIEKKVLNATPVFRVNPITGRVTNPGLYLVEVEDFSLPVILKTSALKEAQKNGHLHCAAEFLSDTKRADLKVLVGHKFKGLPKKVIV